MNGTGWECGLWVDTKYYQFVSTLNLITFTFVIFLLNLSFKFDQKWFEDASLEKSKEKFGSHI